MEWMWTGLALVWGFFLFQTLRAQKNLRDLQSFAPLERKDAPSLSIILAVKDGASELPQTLKKLSELSWEGLEVIVVNDRSRDKTSAVIQEYSFQEVKIEELPSGWLGKVHALHQGSRKARGDYLLFMDGDVEINDEALTRALSACLELKLDHLAVLPEVPPKGFAVNLMMFTSYSLFSLSARPWLSIEERPLHAVKGVGAFNLVRREFLETTEGFSWLKMDVADDVALAQLIAKEGGRSLLLRGPGSFPRLDWYQDFKAFKKGLEKNMVGGFTNYRWEKIIFMSLLSMLTPILPVLGLFFSLKALALYVAFLFFFAYQARKYFSYSFFVRLSLPIGIGILGGLLLRASYLCYKNGGIIWAGTFYPLKELRQGSRVRLGL